MSVISERLSAPRNKRVVKNPVPWYTPRFWHGMCFSTWMKTLARNDFNVGLCKLHTALSITGVTFINSALATLDHLIYSRRIAKVDLAQPPLFILGHWRSGTTFLHELLIRDPRHTFPGTYQCFVPHHFVLTESWLAPLTSILIPKRRPMDNMAAGWKRPQEDEFALCNLGVPTPYLSMLFPKRGPADEEYLDLHNLTDAQREDWCAALHNFFRRVTYRDPRRIVVKSPPHTARVRTLRQLYPQAKFVHIVRDPYEVFISTIGLWKSLNEVQRVQALGDELWLDEFVLSTFERMYAAYNADRELLACNQLIELKYEDLVKNPLESVRTVYEQLELDDFSQIEPSLQKHLAEVKNYRPNQYDLPEEQRQVIRERWADYIARYGY